ncbi:MAG: DUF1624 domain-containing protein [Gemmatimonadetes bacterium]|nr:DUF1624 domain-containing protein [Gemmatimonadota bacterium]
MRYVLGMAEFVERRDNRNLVLDAMRGFAILVIAYGDGLIAWLDNDFTRSIDHAEWEGISYWDVGQAAFLFMAGVAIMLSRERHEGRGENRGAIMRRAIVRAIALFMVGVFLTYFTSGELTLRPTGVLRTIAIGYLIGFGFQFLKPALQLAFALAIPLLHDGLLFLFPGPDGAFDRTQNIGLVIDRALFWGADPGGYASLNVIGGAAVVVMGLWSVRYYRDRHRGVWHMLVPTLGCLGLAFALEAAGIPFIKRAWTSSYHFCVLAVFYAHLMLFALIARTAPGKTLFRSFAVVGRNALVLYVLFNLFGNHVADFVLLLMRPFVQSGPLTDIIPPLGAGTFFWLLAYLLQKMKKPDPLPDPASN